MKRILLLSPAELGDVRTVKISSYLSSKGYTIDFVGWQRTEKPIDKPSYINSVKTLQKGGGHATKWLPILYVVYIIRLFFYLLLKKGLKSYVIYAIDFEIAYPAWLVSKLRNVKYIYDIYDDFAISHNFPPRIVSWIHKKDAKVRKDAAFYIHVDENRVSEIDSSNYIIIYNSPVDVKLDDNIPDYENKFAVTGWLNKTRGLQSIYEFAINNPQISLIVVGEFNQKEYEEKFLKLENVEYHHFMPQTELFKIIGKCRGIFSLYDSSIPINRLAASNKLYDAMMLSIPVVVNKDLMAADFVRTNKIGYVIDYEYGESWSILSTFDKEKTGVLGANGRDLYKRKYEFTTMLDAVLLPKVKEITN